MKEEQLQLFFFEKNTRYIFFEKNTIVPLNWARIEFYKMYYDKKIISRT
jgi:hypothetical protein